MIALLPFVVLVTVSADRAYLRRRRVSGQWLQDTLTGNPDPFPHGVYRSNGTWMSSEQYGRTFSNEPGTFM